MSSIQKRIETKTNSRDHHPGYFIHSTHPCAAFNCASCLRNAYSCGLSGLYYNLNRYYDADSGQYLSPDPIGMAGGLGHRGMWIIGLSVLIRWG